MLYLILTVVKCSVKVQISQKLQTASSMQNQHNFSEKRNTCSIIPILSLVYYKENCSFWAEFSTNPTFRRCTQKCYQLSQ